MKILVLCFLMINSVFATDFKIVDGEYSGNKRGNRFVRVELPYEQAKKVYEGLDITPIHSVLPLSHPISQGCEKTSDDGCIKKEYKFSNNLNILCFKYPRPDFTVGDVEKFYQLWAKEVHAPKGGDGYLCTLYSPYKPSSSIIDQATCKDQAKREYSNSIRECGESSNNVDQYTSSAQQQ